MDWFVLTEAQATPAPAGVPAGPGTTVAGDPTVRSMGESRLMVHGADPGRLDLAVAHAVERLADSVLAGVRVAALFGTQDGLSVSAVPPCGCPSWLAGDLDVLVHLVRLSAAAGVVLPHGVAGAASPELALPPAHLDASRDCYREIIEVLSRMSVAEEVSATCRDDALRLLRQVERRVRHLDEGHPGMASRPPQSVYDHEYVPGELLG